MYIIGLLFYITIPIVAYYLKSAQDFIVTSFQLSPEITVLIGFAYIYPLSVFFMSVVLKKKGFANLAYFRSQVALSSTLSVSFGLIGTFIGLSQMIAGIAAGMGADGDFSSKMASLLEAIGSALDSMSLAFLTSILGVGTSVAILFASNYLSSFYRESDQSNQNEENGSNGGSTKKNVEADENLQKSLVNIESNTQNQQAVTKHLFQALSEKFKQEIDVLKKDQQAHQHAIERVFGQISDHISDQTQSNHNTFNAVSNSIAQMAEITESSHDAICKTIEGTTDQLSSVASILNDLRIQMAIPLEESLANALLDNDLDVVYQVQTNIAGKAIGAEVYVHWSDPVRGLVPNSLLFDVADKHDMLVKLDRWVLKTAIQQVSTWKKLGLWQAQQIMAINVSHKTLVDPGLLNYVETLLENNELEAKNFAFEITENTIMNYPEESRDKIRQISRLGIKVYIDDFGTGYSSLINLKNLKIDRLKIDKDIVQDVLEYSNQEESVIRSIMNIAGDLHIEVSAEGIETQEQLDLLSSVGCTMFQGYFIGRPEMKKEFQLQSLDTLDT